MHDFKKYRLNHNNGTTDYFSACHKCGTIKVQNTDDMSGHNTCSGKMYKTSNVKMLNMQLAE